MNRPGRIEAILLQLQLEPDDVFLNYALGLEYSAIKPDFDKAVGQFEKVLRIDPAYVPAYFHLGKLYEAHGNVARALENYHAGLALAKKKKDLKSASELEEAIFLLEE